MRFLTISERKPADPNSVDLGDYGQNGVENYAKLPSAQGHKISITSILLLFAIVALSVLTAVVLHLSDGDDIASWMVQPSVYLSLTSAGLGPAVAYIYAQGVQVDFWMFCVRGGTLSEIHDRYNVGGDVIAAMMMTLGRRRISRIALACMAVTAMAVQGTFLQKASRTVPSQSRLEALAHLNIAPELPTAFTSTYTGRTTDAAVLNPTFASILQQFQARSTIPVNSTCQGACAGTFAGAGLAANCSTTPFNWTIPKDYYQAYPAVQFNAFRISFSLSWDTVPDARGLPTFLNNSFLEIWRNTRLTVDFYVKDGKEQINESSEVSQRVGFHRQCVLRPATVLYPVIISNSTIRLQGQLLEDEALDLLDAYEPGDYGSGLGTTWQGYASTVSELYSTVINVSYAGAAGYTYDRNGLFGTAYLKNLGDVQLTDGFLNVSFRDPTADVLSGMRELTFRMALAAARNPTSGRWLGKYIPPGSNTNSSSVDAGLYTASVLPFNISNGTTETRNVTVYRTDWVYGGVGIAWTFWMLALITPTFYGFWLLERRVSLSPVETAKAFRSPLLEDVNPQADLDGILAKAGKRRVRYEENGIEALS
ncbi:hypothetical protein H2200_008618 [Cladophialophora chaetospira]|uniref:Uncharacterized protein n=1 Tax=Cladophialophora chaetospira TaxID=386627 RepID=A0AA39CFU8_9EURO|nr:hypothetical protein H2200_008618 [Cladophialophora chaetospira]